MAATTVTTRAVKGSALTHTEMDTNWNNLNNVGIGVGHISIWPMEWNNMPDATWLPCIGGSYAVASYPDLFDVIGYTYGGSGANFNVPDYAGVFLRGVSYLTGRDPDAASRTNRGDGSTGNIVGSRQGFEVQAHTHTVASYADQNTTQGGSQTRPDDATTINSGSTGGSETRPINVNVNFIIKALL